MEEETVACEEKKQSTSPDNSLRSYIEIFGRGGKVSMRVPVTKEEMRLGRAYYNDIVIDDSYVCPCHVRLRFDGERLIAEDLDSVNGLINEKEKKKFSTLTLESGDRFRIGRTLIRFCGLDFPVAKTILDRSAISPLRYLEKPIILAFLYLATIAYVVWDHYMELTERFDSYGLFAVLIGVFAIVVVWSTIWAFAGRIILHKWNFFIHCGIVSLSIMAYSLFETATSYIGFAMAMDDYLVIVQVIGYFVFTAMFLYVQLRFVSSASLSHLATAAAGIAFILVGLVLVSGHLDRKKFTYMPRYKATLKAPLFKMAESKKVVDFFETAKTLKEDVDVE